MALKSRGLAERVIGVARRSETLAQAHLRGAIDEGCLDAQAAVAQADLVVLCLPVRTITTFLESLAPHVRPGTLVTDVGSTKSEVVALGERLLPHRFLGGHPMAGSAENGIEAADANLFEGAWWALTPGPHAAPLEPMMRLVTDLGARPLVLSPEEHDRAVAVTSHLPHVVAAAVAAIVADTFADVPSVPRLVAGSFRDATRVAASSPALWRDVCLTNRAALLTRLHDLQARLSQLRSALETNDASAVERFFAEGKAAKEKIEEARKEQP